MERNRLKRYLEQVDRIGWATCTHDKGGAKNDPQSSGCVVSMRTERGTRRRMSFGGWDVRWQDTPRFSELLVR